MQQSESVRRLIADAQHLFDSLYRPNGAADFSAALHQWPATAGFATFVLLQEHGISQTDIFAVKRRFKHHGLKTRIYNLGIIDPTPIMTKNLVFGRTREAVYQAVADITANVLAMQAADTSYGQGCH